MWGVLVTGPQSVQFRELPDPEVGPGEVRVAVQVSGVCKSDVPIYVRGHSRVGEQFGHEVSGVVESVGAGVSQFEPGQQVTGLFGSGYAQLAVAPESLVADASHLPPMQALGEPVACAVAAVRRLHLEPGARTAVVGLGFMGLLMVQLLRICGASTVLGIDPRLDTHDLAQSCGAETVTDLEGQPACDVVVEATGVQGGLDTATALTATNGMLGIVGYHATGNRVVPMDVWNDRALDVANLHEKRISVKMKALRAGLRLVSVGRLEVAPLVSHRFSLGELPEAFAALGTRPTGFVKAALEVSDPSVPLPPPAP